MIDEHCVTLDSQPVGKVLRSREGLYYIIKCEISLTKPGTYRLWAQTGESRIDLGICVPYGSFFGLTARVPVKKIDPGALTFFLTENRKTRYLEVSDDQPFSDIQQLEKGKFCIKEGKPGIVLRIDS